MNLTRAFSAILLTALFAGCESIQPGGSAAGAIARTQMIAMIAQEPKDAYFVGRRYFKEDYKFWGYVRRSGESWSAAKLVMLNENSKLAPDRAGTKLGTDNDYEYKLTGHFSGDTVYEPASNSFYPEFVLKGAELLTTTPAPIYREVGATNPERRVIAHTY